MREIQPKFAAKVAFFAVDIDYGQDLNELHAFAQEEDYPWMVGLANRDMLHAFGVTVQSTKIAIDADGVIFYRVGYGKGTNEEWISVFEKLAHVTPSR